VDGYIVFSLSGVLRKFDVDTATTCRSQDAPTYRPGLWACIACNLLNLVLVASLDAWFYFQNRAVDRGEVDLEVEEGEVRSVPTSCLLTNMC
jgi:hypothetical protein